MRGVVRKIEIIGFSFKNIYIDMLRWIYLKKCGWGRPKLRLRPTCLFWVLMERITASAKDAIKLGSFSREVTHSWTLMWVPPSLCCLSSSQSVTRFHRQRSMLMLFDMFVIGKSLFIIVETSGVDDDDGFNKSREAKPWLCFPS